MTVKFMTVKGSENLGRAPFYVGIPQHERTMSRRETYEHIAAATGYTPTAVRAVFMAAAEYVRENQRRGNITFIDGVAILAAVVPLNRTEGAKPAINTVLDETTLVYDVITGTDVFSIAGADLAPDTTKGDEYVALASAQGVETKAEITFSDLQNVKAQLASALPAGEYTLKVYTRSGLGDRFGVHVATRKVMVA